MKRRKLLCYLTALIILLTTKSCNNDDFKKVDKISLSDSTISRDRTTGVEILYSDSAMVKAKGNAPIMDKVIERNGKSYQEMIDGVKIVFYNPDQSISATLTSNYAIRQDQEQKTYFKKNVIVKTAKGDTFLSEELIWDETKKIFYSNQLVSIQNVNGDFTKAKKFTAPQDFSSYSLEEAFGEVSSKDVL